MNLKLLKGLTKQDEQEFRANFAQAVQFRKRLREVLDKEIQAVYTSMESEDEYSNPNWPAWQAGKVERVKTLKMIMKWCENEEN